MAVEKNSFLARQQLVGMVIVEAFASVFLEIIDLPRFDFKLGGIVNQFGPVALNPVDLVSASGGGSLKMIPGSVQETQKE